MLTQSSPRQPLFVICALLSILLVLVGALPQHVLSQGAARLVINDLNTSKFPQITAQVSVIDENGEFVSGLDNSAFTVLEDATAIKSEVKQETVGVAVAVIFDTSRNTVDARALGSRGATGELLYTEARSAVTRLLDSPQWLDTQSQKDEIMVLGFVSDTVKVIVPFERDYGKVFNFIDAFEPLPEQSARNTPILAAIGDALRAIQAKPELANRRKAIVVFSDGLDTVSPIDRERVSAQAQREDIPIHTVFLGARETIDAQRNLKTLAEATGGRYVAYRSSESVDPLHTVIFSQKNQYFVSAQSTANTRGQHTLGIQAQIGGANPVTVQAERSFSLDIQTPSVKIINPPPGFRIERRVPQWNSKLEDADNKTMNVQIQWGFPDGRSRSIRQVEYLVDGKPGLPLTQAPFDLFQVDIGNLGNMASSSDTTHYLQVNVTDDLGLKGESEVVPIAVRMVVPLQPTATPTAVPTQTPTPTPTPTPTLQEQARAAAFDYGPLLLSLLALLVAGIVVVRRPQIVTEAPRRIVDRVKEITEPFLPHRLKGERDRKGRAYLSVLDGGEPGQQTIELLNENTRLGRDEGLVNVVFGDKSISRWHATIKEESNGEYRIFDEGSKSGTYVNQEQVPMIGQRLEDGDIVELGGRTRLRFNIRGSISADAVSSQRPSDDDRSTRPMDDLVSGATDDDTVPYVGRDEGKDDESSAGRRDTVKF